MGPARRAVQGVPTLVGGARYTAGMALYKRGRVWWFKFTWRGETVRESTRQANRRVAEQLEAARRTALARGEAGIRPPKAAPSVAAFLEGRFLPHLRATLTGRQRTLTHYVGGVKVLAAYSPLASAPLDRIAPELLTGFVTMQRDAGREIATVNRSLQVLRRALGFAVEWGVIERLPKVRLLPGANRRERVLTPEEEARYFAAAEDLARERLLYTPPVDAYVLRDVATLLMDCALRPGECYVLTWDRVQDGALAIDRGKTASARRTVPLSPRAAAVLAMRARETEWVFPAGTISGHIESPSIHYMHTRACALAALPHFPLYTLRHTCLTRWAPHMDPYTLATLAGHSDFAMTRRYVHPRLETLRAAVEQARVARTGHNTGHSAETEGNEGSGSPPAIN